VHSWVPGAASLVEMEWVNLSLRPLQAHLFLDQGHEEFGVVLPLGTPLPGALKPYRSCMLPCRVPCKVSPRTLLLVSELVDTMAVLVLAKVEGSVDFQPLEQVQCLPKSGLHQLMEAAGPPQTGCTPTYGGHHDELAWAVTKSSRRRQKQKNRKLVHTERGPDCESDIRCADIRCADLTPLERGKRGTASGPAEILTSYHMHLKQESKDSEPDTGTSKVEETVPSEVATTGLDSESERSTRSPVMSPVTFGDLPMLHTFIHVKAPCATRRARSV